MFQPLTFSTVPAGTKLDRFQSVYKERAAIPYVDHNVAVTTVIKAMKANVSGNDSFIIRPSTPASPFHIYGAVDSE